MPIIEEMEATLAAYWQAGNAVLSYKWKEYPELEEEDIRQSLAYAAAHLDDKVLELRGVS